MVDENEEGRWLTGNRSRRTLRELLWLPQKERETRCARCDLVKSSILTLRFKGERFGVCARCLETLWSEVGHATDDATR